jgi:MFS family permease
MSLQERGRPTTGRPARWMLATPPRDGISAHDPAPFGWAPLVVLMAVGFVDAMESRIIGGALPLIIEEFGLSDTMAGAVPTAITIAGAIVTLPAGYLADRYHRTNLMALVVLSWAFLLVGTALAGTFAVFFAMRIVLGAADTIDNPSSSSLLGDLYPPLTRAKAYGWQRVTTFVGGALGTTFGAVVGALLGWRWAYAFMIVPGLVCAWLCWRLREPVRGFMDRVAAQGASEPVPVPPSPDDEGVRATARLRELGAATMGRLRDRTGVTLLLVASVALFALALGQLAGHAIGTGGDVLGAVAAVVAGVWCWRRRQRIGEVMAPIAAAPPELDAEEALARELLKTQLDFKGQVKGIFQIPSLRLIMFGLMAMSFGLGGIVYWAPTLMHRNFDIEVTTAGAVAGLVAAVGMIGGNMHGGRLGRLWHGTRRGGRVLAGGGGLLVGSLLLAVALAMPTLVLFAIVLLAVTWMFTLAIPNLTAAIADVLIASSRGIGFSMVQFLIAGAAAWSPLLVGALSDRIGSLAGAMYVLVLPGLAGGWLVLLARRYFDDDAGRVLDAARRGAT